jgi:diguanylate cyclase (GGDEF)-like protein
VEFNKKKIFLIISCLINIAGIWIAFAIQIRHDNMQTKKSAETNIFNLAKAFEEHVNSEVKDIDRLLLNLRSEYKEGFAHFIEESRIIDEYGYDNRLIHLSVINRKGILIYTDQPSTQTPLETTERKQFVNSFDIKKDSLFISRPLLDKLSKEWNIQFIRKLYNKDGSFTGIMIASTHSSFFSDFFQSIDIGSNGAITLYGVDRYILARASGLKNIDVATGLQVAEDHPFISKRVQNGIYSSKSIVDGVLRLSAYRKLQNYPLYVQVGLAEKDIFLNSANRKKDILIVGTIITAALLGALAILLQFEREQQKLMSQLSKRDEQLQVTLKELEHLVTTDTLTGLPNRRSFFSRVQTEFTRSNRYGRPLSLIMIDVDHFKDVNDQYGHLVGDAALKHISEIMLSCIRESDMVARYGGEEFIIILPETDAEGSRFIAERVRTDIEASRLNIDPATELSMTVSMGIACMSTENQFSDIDKLLQNADDAMYKSKTSGRNCVSMTSET